MAILLNLVKNLEIGQLRGQITIFRNDQRAINQWRLITGKNDHICRERFLTIDNPLNPLGVGWVNFF